MCWSCRCDEPQWGTALGTALVPAMLHLPVSQQVLQAVSLHLLLVGATTTVHCLHTSVLVCLNTISRLNEMDSRSRFGVVLELERCVADVCGGVRVCGHAYKCHLLTEAFKGGSAAAVRGRSVAHRCVGCRKRAR